MSSIPLVMGLNGPVSTSPTTFRDTIVSDVQSTNPDYTANLPASLIEDILSTDVGALALIDQARIDAVNSVTPYGANAYVLAQLGAQFGIVQGVGTNTSVYVQFSGSVGYTISAGFIVSDGTHQYVLQDGGVIDSSGSTSLLYAVANQAGTWSVPAGSVTTIVTSVPSGYTLTVTNPQAGVGSTSAETVDDYRARVLESGVTAVQGTPTYLKSLVKAVSGVDPRLVAVQQVTNGWEVICGGGDTYDVAYAILSSAMDLSSLYGSSIDTGRNVNVSILDYPDTYSIVYVNAPQQMVTMTVTWNTTLTSFTAATQVNQLGQAAIQSYINGIYVGQPINELEMTAAFQSAIASVLDPNYLTTLTYSVSINGTVTPPNAGTSIIPGDSESYFYADLTGITVAQG